MAKDFNSTVVFEADERFGTPHDVMEEVRELWADKELGNDNYYYSFSLDSVYSDDTTDYPKIAEYLKSMNHSKVLIHYWW